MELWDLYNSDRVKTDKIIKRGEAAPSGYYRLVVHACIFNSKGQMLIQQRQPFKSGWSNLWDITCGGSAIKGETSNQAVHRELLEEIGFDYDFSKSRPRITANFDEGFDDVYVINSDVDIDKLNLQYEEVQTVKWADYNEIVELIRNGQFIPYFESFIKILFDIRNQESACSINEKHNTFIKEMEK